MSRKGQGRASAALAILAALVVGAGLALSGGPMQARAERRDETRMEDLRNIANKVQCLAVQNDYTLPATIENTEACPNLTRMADPFTGEAYRFEVIDGLSFRVCAGFERPLSELISYGDDVDVGRGCLVDRITRPAPAPVLQDPAPEIPPTPAD